MLGFLATKNKTNNKKSEKNKCWGGLGTVFAGLDKKCKHYAKNLCDGIKGL